MSSPGRTFLIDGSNTVQMLFGPLERHEADRCEKDFLRFVSEWAEQQPNTEVEIVFDGAWRAIPGCGTQVRVMFAEEGPADALILERLRALRFFRRKVSVVTQDRALADAARAEEAKMISPASLWRWLAKAEPR